MKKILFGVLGLLALVSACNDDHEDVNAPTQVVLLHRSMPDRW